MADAHKYLVPEYYSGFSCKGGECRSTCCHGWGISFSMKEYFRLIGLACPPPLRRKLDGAFHLADNPTEDRYAQITPDWLGNCPLHMKNGLCQLHAECGEEALGSVCRYYPRGVHTEYQRECSCANSCEKVIEMLFEMEEPMRFEEKEMSFELPGAQGDPETLAARYYGAVRKLAIEALQNRRYSLPDRLTLVGGMMRLLNEAFRNGEEWIISGALEVCREMTPPPAENRKDRMAMQCLYRLCRMFSENDSVEELIRHGLNRLGLSVVDEPDERQLSEAVDRYDAAREAFGQKFPRWQRLFEQMMVNHAFFDEYPFSDKRESLWEAHVSLCAAYAFVRFLAVLQMEKEDDGQALVDVCAAVFRLIEHSGFGWNAVSLLEAGGVRNAEDVAQLVMV